MKTVLSCIQPTGEMHFGNYFGAVTNYVRLQKSYRCFYGVVDLHAITMPYKPAKLRENTWAMAFDLVAAGVEPENLFIQSLVPEHAELGWILNCFASYGQLTRMTQFKDKSAQTASGPEAFVSVGLFDYPVLQAADILIYRADYVPVGRDQEQHLELTRNIAARFNAQVGRDYFVAPEGLYTETPKIASTADPTRKMGKSLGPKHYIPVFAEADQIRRQIRSAVTDTGGQRVTGELSPGVANLLSLLNAAGQSDAAAGMREPALAGTLRYSELKEAVAEALVGLSAGLRERRAEVRADKKAVKARLRDSSAAIRERARETLREVKDLAGLLN